MFAIDHEHLRTPAPKAGTATAAAADHPLECVSCPEPWKKRTADERALPRAGRKPRKSRDPAPA
jgi:hypothetical protein